jgi:hypothetical protein
MENRGGFPLAELAQTSQEAASDWPNVSAPQNKLRGLLVGDG